LKTSWEKKLGGMSMTASIYRTVTNEIVKGEIIKSQSQQDMLIIQDKKGYFHVVEPIPATTTSTPHRTKD
jgi:hypothetical protein